MTVSHPTNNTDNTMGSAVPAREGSTEGASFEAHQLRVAANFPADSVEYRVALYHDHVEDGLGDVPADVLDHVYVLTRWPDETYMAYIERIRDYGDPVAVAVKLADLHDNLARCHGYHRGTRNPNRAVRYEEAIKRLSDVRPEGADQ